MTTSQTEPEIIAPNDARDAIYKMIKERLGEHWDSEWLTIHKTDYLVRLTRGNVNLDFQCDLLGQVDVIERDINPLQASGRLVAWTILVATLFIALFIAIATGIIQ